MRIFYGIDLAFDFESFPSYFSCPPFSFEEWLIGMIGQVLLQNSLMIFLQISNSAGPVQKWLIEIQNDSRKMWSKERPCAAFHLK